MLGKLDGKGRTGEQDRLGGKAGNVGNGGRLDGKGKVGEQDRLGGKAGNVGNGGWLDGKGQDRLGGTTEIVGGALEVIESRNKVTFFFNLVIWSKFI